jgi:polar amino acid transport system ATP-binding protein
MSVKPPAIELRGIRKSFGKVDVLNGVDLEIAPREVICLIGPSGSGKSTLLKCINMLQPPDAGTIRLNRNRAASSNARVTATAADRRSPARP